MYRNISSNYFRVEVVIQLGLRTVYIVIHVIWNLYAGNGAWGSPFSWGPHNFMTPGRDPRDGCFSGFIVIGTVNIRCTKRSSPYLHRCLTLASGQQS